MTESGRNDIQTDVLIVGAGPTGLALACQLVRYDIEFVIIDKNTSVTSHSKAIGVQARTLEIYEQLGLAQKAIDRGAVAGTARLLAGGEVRGELHLSDIGEGLSPYPFLLMLEQSKNEQLLFEYLQRHGQDVEWTTELGSLAQNSEGVVAQLKTADSSARTVSAKYLVGCDGAKSPVRHMLNLEFSGSTLERLFYVADAQIDWELSHESLHFCLSQETFLLFFPLKGDKRYRIVGVFPEEFAKDEGEVLYEEIEQRVKDEAQLALNIHDVEWFSTYKVHSRHVSRFASGRCFLAGDAAHVHTPAGAQGMNTGIQDGYNLAWKLALVLKGAAPEALLETYNEERLQNARDLLRTTDRLFEAGTSPARIPAFIRTTVFPPFAGYALRIERVRKAIFSRISQIGISYRHSSLSSHSDENQLNVQAGDRLPYFRNDGRSIYDQLHRPAFHLLIFADEPTTFRHLTTELDEQYAPWVETHFVPMNAQVDGVFGTTQPFQVLTRPDNYLALISSEVSAEAVNNYLSTILNRT